MTPDRPLLPKVEDVHKNFLLYRNTDGMIDEWPAIHIKAPFGYCFSSKHKDNTHSR